MCNRSETLLCDSLQKKKMNDIFEKNSVTLILLKIFDIYLCHYFATNKKIAIIHLWHAIEPQTTCQLIAKDKVGEQHI